MWLKVPDAKPERVRGRCFAILVDTENVSPAFAPRILAEAMKHGTVEIRRAFGAVAHSGWDGALVRHAFHTLARTAHAGGRNAADIELAIAAMDLLHDNRIDGFCLVSSDSDFAPLAIRLRQSGHQVLGVGERKTPGAFVEVCDHFAFLDLLAKPMAPLKSDDRWIDICVIGAGLRKLDPDFQPSKYGHKRSKALLQSCKLGSRDQGEFSYRHSQVRAARGIVPPIRGAIRPDLDALAAQARSPPVRGRPRLRRVLIRPLPSEFTYALMRSSPFILS